MICAETSKRGFKSKRKARRMALNAHINNPLPGETVFHLMVYKCSKCDHFHWGHGRGFKAMKDTAHGV